jgi:hypothetical protein
MLTNHLKKMTLSSDGKAIKRVELKSYRKIATLWVPTQIGIQAGIVVRVG